MREPLRPDIEQARRLMSNRFGSARRVKDLRTHLEVGEQVERIASGEHRGDAGLLVLTDRRLVFVKTRETERPVTDFPLAKISSVQWVTGGGAIVLVMSGDKTEISGVPKKDGTTLTEVLHTRIGFKTQQQDRPGSGSS